MPDFYHLLNEDKPLWVTNHSGGKIILELKREGHKNKPYTAKLPPIKDFPFLLTKLVPLPIIKYDHSTIFEWIKKGLIKLHDPKTVEDMYTADPELLSAVEEMVTEANRDRQFQSKDIGLTTADGAKDRANVFTGKEDVNELMGSEDGLGTDELVAVRNGTAVTLNLAEGDQKVSAKVTQLMGSAVADSSSQQDVLVKLKTLDQDLMTKDALGFIIENSSNLPSINKWARSKRADLVGGAGEGKKRKQFR